MARGVRLPWLPLQLPERRARRRVVRLTPAGEHQFRSLQAALSRADAAFAQLFDGIGCNLTIGAASVLDALDRRLQEKMA